MLKKTRSLSKDISDNKEIEKKNPITTSFKPTKLAIRLRILGLNEDAFTPVGWLGYGNWHSKNTCCIVKDKKDSVLFIPRYDKGELYLKVYEGLRYLTHSCSAEGKLGLYFLGTKNGWEFKSYVEKNYSFILTTTWKDRAFICDDVRFGMLTHFSPYYTPIDTLYIRNRLKSGLQRLRVQIIINTTNEIMTPNGYVPL